MEITLRRQLPALLALLLANGMAFADIKIGVIASSTGPTAVVGIPQKQTVALLPTEIGGQKVEYIVLDDASDPTNAVTNVKKLISDQKVDALIGPTTTPAALAMLDFVAESKTPLVTTVGSSAIIQPMDDKKKWVFKTTQNDDLIAEALIEHMTAHGVKTLGFIGFNDPYGENWFKVFGAMAEKAGLKLLVSERFNRTDQSVTGQALKVIAARPDAVLVAATGGPAVLPQTTLQEKGYKGRIYQTHGVANNDFLRVCGKDCEDTVLPTGPVLVAAQLPADNPVKKSAMEYVGKYEAVHGKGSVNAFGGYAWDAGILLANAAPVALKKAQPGSKEFRAALRDALEATRNVAGAHGVYNMSANDHLGLDQRARVMVNIKDGAWQLAR